MQRPLQALRDNGQRTTNRRGAFSLIELIVVILIIVILSSLLLVGVQAAVGRARVAAVAVDITNLEQGIKEFQAKFNVSEPPPSGLILFEEADDWVLAPTGKNTPQNLALIRRLWPNFLKSNGKPDLNGDGTVDNDDDQDINGNGSKADVIYLNGAECLVFFLGGIMEKDATTSPATYVPHGFSTNPANPFFRPSASTDPWGTRMGPFTDLKPSRLIDDTTGGADDMPLYLDAFPGSRAPYQYFSAYGGRGYRIFGVDEPAPTMAPTAATSDDEVVWVDSANVTLFSVYLQKDNATGSALPKGTPWNAKGYQIISAGRDGLWGVGGQVGDDGIQTTGAAPYRDGTRGVEKDNLTNFKGGLLN